MRNVDFLRLSGDIITKEDNRYMESILSWNRAIKANPLVIIYCKEDSDVINAIKWAKEEKIEVRIRSGSHSYEGYSTGNNVAIIDISKMKDINIDEKSNIVKFGSGITNKEAYEALGEKGYTFPGGGCPTVGITGLILGGGWGYSSRYLGLACDSLIEGEIINYKGERLIINKDTNSDLLWALKGGGGGNFGVITSLTLRLPRKETDGTLINLRYKDIKEDKAIEVIDILQNMYKSLDDKMNLKTAIYNSSTQGKGIKIIGLYYGCKNIAKEILKPLLEIDENLESNLEEKSLLECNRWIQDSHPDYEKYKSTGRFVYKVYTKEELEEIIKLIDNPAKGSTYTAITFYGLGGKILEVDKSETAFYYRDAKFILGLQSVWEEDEYAEENNRWILKAFGNIKKLTKGSFINFPLKEIENYEEEYYGENKEKIKKVKGKYDKEGFFKFPQSIKGVN
ncbi:FAD-binding oxidoreductase [Clostridium sp.]|uniref:FAD-binding oxidoreductase n=1 Tax=Clostridium sp. TaxID=1506 RepID=UPI002622C11C|nr:FAD-dependent oxidoreductase [Clostridium sp.]